MVSLADPIDDHYHPRLAGGLRSRLPLWLDSAISTLAPFHRWIALPGWVCPRAVGHVLQHVLLPNCSHPDRARSCGCHGWTISHNTSPRLSRHEPFPAWCGFYSRFALGTCLLCDISGPDRHPHFSRRPHSASRTKRLQGVFQPHAIPTAARDLVRHLFET